MIAMSLTVWSLLSATKLSAQTVLMGTTDNVTVTCGIPCEFYDSGGPTCGYKSGEVNDTCVFRSCNGTTLGFALHDWDVAGPLQYDPLAKALPGLILERGKLTLYDGELPGATELASLTGQLSFDLPKIYNAHSGTLTVTFEAKSQLVLLRPGDPCPGCQEKQGWHATIACLGDCRPDSAIVMKDGSATLRCGEDENIPHYRFYDSGGEACGYKSEEDYTYTFHSECGSPLTMAFSKFKTGNATSGQPHDQSWGRLKI